MGTINFPDNGEGQLPDLNRVTIYNVLLLLCRSDWLALNGPVVDLFLSLNVAGILILSFHIKIVETTESTSHIRWLIT